MDLLYDADDEIEIELVPAVESTDEISESEWEVSDFFSSDDSCDEWHPWQTLFLNQLLILKEGDFF